MNINQIESGEYDQNYPELKDEFKVYLEQFDWENKITEVTEIQWLNYLIGPKMMGNHFLVMIQFTMKSHTIFSTAAILIIFINKSSQPILLHLNLVRKLLKVIIKSLA